MKRTVSGLGRFLASVVVVNAVLFGVPALLWLAVGWPLPDAVPTTGELRGLVEPGGVSEEAVVKFFAVIGWLSWARVAWALLDELVGALYGRAPRGDGSFSIAQKFAEWAVAGLFRLGVSSAAVMGVAGAPASMAVVALTAPPAAGETPPQPVIARDGDGEVELVGRGSTARSVSPLVGRVPYEVVDGDTFWDISERHLGDAFRWREIFDVADGVRQPFAFDKAIESPDLIWPGSIVLLPDDAVNVPKVDPARVSAVWGDDVVPVIPPTPDVAPDRSADVTADVAVPDVAGDLAAGLEAAANDAVAQATKPSMEPPIVTSTAAPGTQAPVTVQVEPSRVDQESVTASAGWLSSGRSLAAVGLGSGGLLFASWMFVRLSRARRARQMVMERKQRAAGIPEELQDTQRHISQAADVEFAQWLDAAWGSLASRPLPGSRDAAVPMIAFLGKSHLQVLLSGYDPNVVGPWSLAVGSGEAGCIWEVDFATPVEAFGEIPEWMTLPLMVTVGDTMLANLEAIGLLSVFGDAEKSAGFVRSMVSEMQVGPHGDFVEVKVTTSAAEVFGTSPGADVATINAELLEWFGGIDALVTSSAVTSVSSARAESPAEWAPVVLVCTSNELDGFAELVELAENPQVPLAIVCVGATAARYRAEIGADGQLFFGPKQHRCVAAYADVSRSELADRLLVAQREVVELSGEELERRTVSVFSSPPGMVPLREDVVEEVLVAGASGGAAEDLAVDRAALAQEPVVETEPVTAAFSFASAPVGESVEPEAAPGNDDPVSADPVDAAETEPVDEGAIEAEQSPPEVVVSSLDELPDGMSASNDAVVVDVRDDTPGDHSDGDADEQLVLSVLGDVRLRGVELTQVELSIVTFLMMTGHQTAWAIRSAIWEDEISTGHWERVVSTLRGKIGRARFPYAEGGQYGLVGVHTDYSLFLSLWDKAKASGDDRSRLEHLHSALALVRGIPLQVGAYDRYWSWVFNHDFAMASELENNVVEAAMETASLALRLGEMEHARFACVQGTLASPSCERLTSLMVKIYVQQGDQGKAARLVESFERQARDLCPGVEPPEGPREALRVRAS